MKIEGWVKKSKNVGKIEVAERYFKNCQSM
jgi:hypothetical protein